MFFKTIPTIFVVVICLASARAATAGEWQRQLAQYSPDSEVTVEYINPLNGFVVTGRISSGSGHVVGYLQGKLTTSMHIAIWNQGTCSRAFFWVGSGTPLPFTAVTSGIATATAWRTRVGREADGDADAWVGGPTPPVSSVFKHAIATFSEPAEPAVNQEDVFYTAPDISDGEIEARMEGGVDLSVRTYRIPIPLQPQNVQGVEPGALQFILEGDAEQFDINKKNP